MTRLEEFLAGVLVVISIAVGGWFALEHYGTTHYKAGYAAAVEAGVKLRQAEADRNREAENDLRARLAEKDEQAQQKEQEYATNLDAAQRRVRAGTDRLRCPSVSPVQPTAAAGDRPTAAGPTLDGQGAELVPDAAAEILGDGATIAGIVRKFDRLEQRFEACRAMNAKP